MRGASAFCKAYLPQGLREGKGKGKPSAPPPNPLGKSVRCGSSWVLICSPQWPLNLTVFLRCTIINRHQMALWRLLSHYCPKRPSQISISPPPQQQTATNQICTAGRWKAEPAPAPPPPTQTNAAPLCCPHHRASTAVTTSTRSGPKLLSLCPSLFSNLRQVELLTRLLASFLGCLNNPQPSNPVKPLVGFSC